MPATAISEKKIQNTNQYSFDEYLRKEEKTIHKHEFYNGQIIKMSGAKYRHNQAASNTIFTFTLEVRKLPKKYSVLNSDQKIYIEQDNVAVYPDALVICEAPIFWNNREDIIINPLVVVEVLSRSTAGFDRTLKFMHYKTLPSFKEYVLIDTDKLSIDIWHKKSENIWELTTYNHPDNILQLKSIGISFALNDIFFGLTLQPKI